MCSPRWMPSVLLTAVVLAVGLVASGTAAGVPAAHHPLLISYGAHGRGVVVRPDGGISRLKGTSAAFKQHVRVELSRLRAAIEPALRSACRNAPTVVVARYRTDGWAYIANEGLFAGDGAPESCARGGAYGVWHRTRHGWRTVVGGQELPTCRSLARLGVPSNVWAQGCYRLNHEVRYGRGPGSNSPSCSRRALFRAAASHEGFDPADPSYASMSEGPTVYGARCYDGWAVALVSRPEVGTTDGGTLFDVSQGRWTERAQIGAAMPCTLRPQGVSERDISHLTRAIDSPAYCG
ncbi:MAG: hypothetical protein ACTHNS_12785 [Marmoricola sp.]